MKKDYVDFKYVKAIGVPYEYYSKVKGEIYAQDTLKKVINLMNKYNISVPVVDTSCFNKRLNNCKIR